MFRKMKKVFVIGLIIGLIWSVESACFALGEMPEDIEAKKKAQKETVISKIQESFCRLTFLDANAVPYEKIGILDSDTGYILVINLIALPKNAQVLYHDGTQGEAERVRYNQYLGVHVYKTIPKKTGGIRFYPESHGRVLLQKIELIAPSGIKEAGVFGPAKIVGGMGILIDKGANPGDIIFYRDKCFGIVGLPIDSPEISLGIPYLVIKSMISELEEKGTVEKPFLGVLMSTKEEGVSVIEVVNNSSAQKAGIKKGDIIKKLNGVDMKMNISVQEIVSESNIGDKLNVEIERGSETLILPVTLEGSSH